MTRNRPITILAGAALVPLTALAVSACGGGNSATAASQTPKRAAAPTQPVARHAPTVRVARTHLGKILVNSRGRTLYLFKKDSGTKSACFGACATAWPPLRAGGKPTVGAGAKASLLGTTRRSDGKPQVTYNGHPLYTFIMDKKAGQTNGEGFSAFGARWFVLSPAGKQISARSSKASGASSPAAPAPSATPTPKPAAPAPTPTPTSTPAPTSTPPASNGIPQNNGGDQDSDNNGGPSDGDGGI